MKKLKCYKCGIYFKDRKDPKDKNHINAKLCWDCRFIWITIGQFLRAMGQFKENREVQINIDDIKIIKRRKQGTIIKIKSK